MPAVSVYEEVLAAVASAITGFSLSGIASVVNEDAPQRTDRTLPYVSVCPALQGETPSGGTNQRDDWTYNVQVAIIAKKESSPLATVLGWRQTLRRRLNNMRLDVSSITLGTQINVTCVPQVPIDQAALQAHKVYVSVLLVRVEIREGRT